MGGLRVEVSWFCALLGRGLLPAQSPVLFTPSRLLSLQHLGCFRALSLRRPPVRDQRQEIQLCLGRAMGTSWARLLLAAVPVWSWGPRGEAEPPGS